jgi:hypothetical protein
MEVKRRVGGGFKISINKLKTQNSNLGISIEAIPTGILYMKHDHHKKSSLCGFAYQDLLKKLKIIAILSDFAIYYT